MAKRRLLFAAAFDRQPGKAMCSTGSIDQKCIDASAANTRVASFRSRAARLFLVPQGFALALLTFVSIVLSGCGASSAPTISAISFPNGSTSSVAPGAAIAMSTTVANDPKALGSTWLATCTPANSITPVTSATSALCGLFTPAHTSSGQITNYTAPDAIPTNGTVTITATSETDPSRSSSTTLNISGPALAVTITPSTATVEVAGSADFTATVANDPANGGVTWTLSCGQQAGILCGGFDPTFETQTAALASGQPITYYAPPTIPLSAVTLTATSVTNTAITAQATVTVVPAIAVSFFSNPPSSLAPGATARLAAVVANDTTSAGVTWSATCAAGGTACGTFSPQQTASGVTTIYAAPSGAAANGLSVTITATSVADPTKTATANILIASNISVAISSAPSTISTGGTASVAAIVVGDSANAGVKWTATAGSFNPTQTSSGVATTYTAPATAPNSGTVTLTATSLSDPTKTATVTVGVVAAPSISIVISASTAMLQVGGTAAFTATVTNDSANAGVRWTALTGSFSPTQTASGAATTYTAPATVPSGGTVIITATSITDPTKTATATVSVTAPIRVTISPANITLQVGTTGLFIATVANDAANAGVTWTASAGSLSQMQTANGAPTTYTVPGTAGTATITATSVSNPAVSATATVTISTQVQPISVTVIPTTATLAPGGATTFAAIVSSDSANAGVTWTATGGSFSQTQTANGASTTYTAPGSLGTLTVTATSVSNPSATATATVTVSAQVQPISITIAPATASLAPGGTTSFTATVANDSADAGVTWTATDGTFSPTQTDSGTAATYTAPSSTGTITVTATSVTDPTKSDTATVTITAPSANTLLNGQYAIAMTGTDTIGGNYETYVGSITADGNGHITGGELDYTSESISGNTVHVPTLRGTYDLQVNGRGNIVIRNAQLNYSLTLSVTVVNASHALVMSDYTGANSLIATGTLDLQTVSSFTSPLSGKYAFTYLQPEASNPGLSEGGVMTIASGVVTNYLVDENLAGIVTAARTYTATDTFSPPDSNGRGTVTLTDFLSPTSVPSTSSFVYYLVDPTTFILEGTGDAGLARVYQQPATLPTSLAGNYAFTAKGFDTGGDNWIDAGGVFTCDSNGNLTTGTLDVNNQQAYTTGTPITGTCALDSSADGRGTITVTANNNGGISSFAVYPTASHGNLLLGLDTDAIGAGAAYVQAAGVSAATFSGTYAANIQSWSQLDFAVMLDGTIKAAGTSPLSGLVDISASSTTDPFISGYALTGGALTDTGGGRLTGDLQVPADLQTSPSATPPGDLLQVFYVVDANTVLALESDSFADTGTGTLQLQTFPGAGTVLPIAIDISPSTASIAPGATASFTAVVSNDPSNGGVTWTASAGSFSPTQTASGAVTTYTAPNATSNVTITATSVTDPTKSAIVSVIVAPPSTAVSVTVLPANSFINLGGSTTFAATVINDTANAGVTWTATAGSFSTSTTATGATTIYTAPSASGTVTVTATSVTDPTKSATATVTISTPSSNTLLSGQYAIAMIGINAINYETFAGSLTADGNGNIVGGEADITSAGLQNQTMNIPSLTGTYNLAANGHGTITLTNDDLSFSLTLSITVVNAQHATIIVDATAPTNETDVLLSGTLDQQTPSSFATPLNGGYAFTYLQPQGFNPALSEGGVLTITNGVVTHYLVDENAAGTVNSYSFAATDNFTAPDVNGRGTVTLSRFLTGASPSQQTFIYYMVDGTHFLLEGETAAGLGRVYQQAATLPTSLAGSYAFTEKGFDPGAENWIDAGGVFTCNGSGLLTTGTLDVNNEQTITTGHISGTCALDSSPDGRGTLTITNGSNGGISTFALYPTASHGTLMLNLDNDAIGAGAAYQQAAGVSATTFSGTYAANIQSFFQLGFAVMLNGTLNASGTAALTGTVDESASSTSVDGYTVSGGALTDTGSGRLTGDIPTPSSDQATTSGDLLQIFYIIDANNVLTLENESQGDIGTGVLQLQVLSQ